jgi:hypothetical protein
MKEEDTTKYNEMVQRVNSLMNEELIKLVESDQCPFEPEHLKEVPLGMFHCPICEKMVVAGISHPRNYN